MNSTEPITEKSTDGPTEWPTNGPTLWPTETATTWQTDGPTNVPTETPTDRPTDRIIEMSTTIPTDATTQQATTIHRVTKPKWEPKGDLNPSTLIQGNLMAYLYFIGKTKSFYCLAYLSVNTLRKE